MKRPDLSETSSASPDRSPQRECERALTTSACASALIISTLLGLHVAASVESWMSGAPLLTTLGVWLTLSPIMMTLTAIIAWVYSAARDVFKSALQRAQSVISARLIYAVILVGVSAYTGIAMGVERLYLFTLSYVADPTVIAPLLSALIIMSLTLAAPLICSLTPFIHRALIRVPHSLVAPITLIYVILVIGGSLMSFSALLHRAELAHPCALLVGALIVASVCLTACLRGRAMITPRLALLALCIHAALITQGVKAYSADERAQRALDAGRGVTPLLAKLARRLSDRDGDGFGVWLGGRDCDDRAPHINPDALELPNNGVDEDCDGADGADQKQVPDTPQSTQKQVPDTSQNLLIITIDALRADHVSWSQAGHSLTPNLDRLARSGLVFRRAYAPAASTRYSVPSLLMGAPLSEVALDWRGRYLHVGEEGQGRARDAHTKSRIRRETLMQRLKRSGYHTAAYTGDLLINGMWYGLERGVDRYVGLERAQLRRRSSREITRAGAQQVLSWCRGHRSRVSSPWALWLHYLDPHEPYLKHADHDYGSSDRARYRAEIAATDAQLGVLLASLKRCADDRRTIIVVTADHGEEFGEHGRRFHGKQLFDESVRVPLLIHVPGAARVEVHEPRSTADMVETVADLLALPPTSIERRRSQSHAHRLTAAAQIDRVASPGRRPFFVYRLHNERPRLLSLAVIDSPHKLIFDVRSGRAQLYNLDLDPQERRELSAAEPQRARDLTRRARAEARRFRRHVYRSLRARRVSRSLPHHLQSSAGPPVKLTSSLTLLATERRAREVGAQTLREVSAWVRVDAPLERRPHISARWSDPQGDMTTERPLTALAGLYPYTQWRVGEVIELLSAERIPERAARRVELIFKPQGQDPLVISLNERDPDPR